VNEGDVERVDTETLQAIFDRALDAVGGAVEANGTPPRPNVFIGKISNAFMPRLYPRRHESWA